MGWPRGEAAACKAVYTGSNPVPTSVKTLVSGFDWMQGAIGAAVARFPDTEEVTGSIPVSPTTRAAPPELLFFVPGAVIPCAAGPTAFTLWADTLGTPVTSS